MLKFIFLVLAFCHQGFSYSALEDERIIRTFLSKQDDRPTDHAKVARELVHKSNWGSAGTLSTAKEVFGYPMVNIISIADSGIEGPSTGVIYFMLTTLDFTGQDVLKNNKITFMVSNDENLACSKMGTDPMEPTCARAIFTGKVIYMKPEMKDFKFGMDLFVSRHPAAVKWLNAHTFELCKLEIENIFVLDWYGGPHNVKPEDYYNVKLNEIFSSQSSAQLEKDLDWAAKYYNKKDLSIKIPKNLYKRINLKF